MLSSKEKLTGNHKSITLLKDKGEIIKAGFSSTEDSQEVALIGLWLLALLQIPLRKGA